MCIIKSKKRVADHREVFTPRWLVEKMLNLVKGETERIDWDEIREKSSGTTPSNPSFWCPDKWPTMPRC